MRWLGRERGWRGDPSMAKESIVPKAQEQETQDQPSRPSKPAQERQKSAPTAKATETSPLFQEPDNQLFAVLHDEFALNRRTIREFSGGKLVPLATDSWYANCNRLRNLPSDLRNSLDSLYADITLLNQLVWLSSEFNRNSPSLRQQYVNLSASIGDKIDELVKPTLNQSPQEGYSEKTVITQPEAEREEISSLPPSEASDQATEEESQIVNDEVKLETLEPGESYSEERESPSGRVYIGIVRLRVMRPVRFGQIKQCERLLTSLPNVKLASTSGSSSEGVDITISLEEPIALAEVLSSSQLVSKIVEKRTRLEIFLNEPETSTQDVADPST